MKQKIFIIALSSILLIGSLSPVFAISFGKKIEKAVKETTSSADGIEDRLLKKVNNKIDSVTSKIEKKIDAKTEKITDIIAEAEGYVQQARDLKSKAESYIKIAKIVIAVLSSTIIILLLLVWRIWRNIVNMKKAFKAVVNYGEVQKRIKALEQQVAELKAAKK